MNKTRLNLYKIDMKYVRNLHKKDDRVSSVSPQIGKHHRLYFGIIVICNKRKYLIPLSHPVKKHERMKPCADFDKVFSPKGKLIGVLNYNLMIPVDEKQLILVDLSVGSNDSKQDIQYKKLCADELRWCRKHVNDIVNKANVLYKLCTSISNYKGKSRCLNFKKLEEVCDKYNKKLYPDKQA